MENIVLIKNNGCRFSELLIDDREAWWDAGKSANRRPDQAILRCNGVNSGLFASGHRDFVVVSGGGGERKVLEETHTFAAAAALVPGALAYPKETLCTACAKVSRVLYPVDRKS